MAYYPLPIRLLLLAILAASFHPRVAKSTDRTAVRLGAMLSAGEGKGARGAGLFLGSSLVFYLIAARTQLLGDGWRIVETLKNALARGDLLGQARQILAAEHVAPFTKLAYLFLAKAGSLGGLEPDATLRIVSAILGGAFVTVLAKGVSGLTRDDRLRAYGFLFVLFSGGVEIFFGYIELYGPVVLLLALYFLNAHRCLKGKGNVVAPAVYLVLAMTAHVGAVLFLPSLGLLLIGPGEGTKKAGSEAGERRRGGSGAFAAIAFLTALAFLAGSKLGKTSPHYLPLLSSGNLPGMFSLVHLADVLNELFLVFPSLLFLLAATLGPAGASERTRGGVQEARGPEGDRFRSDLKRFGAISALAGLLFILVFKAPNGEARDWDVLAVAALGLWPLFVLGIDKMRARGALLGAAMALTVIQTSAWVVLNAWTGPSVRRYRNVIGYYKYSEVFGYQSLSMHFAGRGQLLPATQALEEAARLRQDKVFYYDLGIMYSVLGDTTRSIENYRKALIIDAGLDRARRKLVTLLDLQGRYQELATVAEEGISQSPADPYYYFFLGKSYLYLGKLRKGVRMLLECKKLNPPPGMLKGIDNLLSRVHRRRRDKDQ